MDCTVPAAKKTGFFNSLLFLLPGIARADPLFVLPGLDVDLYGLSEKTWYAAPRAKPDSDFLLFCD